MPAERLRAEPVSDGGPARASVVHWPSLSCQEGAAHLQPQAACPTTASTTASWPAHPDRLHCISSERQQPAGVQCPAGAETSDGAEWCRPGHSGHSSLPAWRAQQEGSCPGSSPSTQATPLAGPEHGSTATLGGAVAQHPGPLQQSSLARLSLKLFNIQPQELPPHVQGLVTSALTQDPVFVDTFVRPGCTQLVIDALVTAAEREQLQRNGAAGLAWMLLQCSGWQSGAGEPWSGNMLVQFGSEVAIINSGVVAAVVRAEAAAPHLLAIRPVAMVAASGGPEPEQGAEPSGQEMLEGGTAFMRTFGEGTVALWGYGIAGPENDVICRQQGRTLDIEVIDRGMLPPSSLASITPGRPSPEWVLVRPNGVEVGILQFEVQRGGLLSAPVSLVALPSRAAAAEAQQAHRTLAGSQDGRGFVQCLGLVLQHLGPGTAARSAVPSASGEGGGTDASTAPSLHQHQWQQQHQHMAHSGDSASSLPGGDRLPGTSSAAAAAAGASAGGGPQAPHPRAIAMAEHLLVAARAHNWGELASLLELLLGSHAAARGMAARSGSEASMQTDSSSEDASKHGHGRRAGGPSTAHLGPAAGSEQQQGEGDEDEDGDASMEGSGMGPSSTALRQQGLAAAMRSSAAAGAGAAAEPGRQGEGNAMGDEARCSSTSAVGAVEQPSGSAACAEAGQLSEMHLGAQFAGEAAAALDASLPRDGSEAGSKWLGGSSGGSSKCFSKGSSSSGGSSSKLSSEGDEDEDEVWPHTPGRIQWLRWMLKQPRVGGHRDGTWQGVLHPSTWASVAAVGLAILVMRNFMGAA